VGCHIETLHQYTNWLIAFLLCIHSYSPLHDSNSNALTPCKENRVTQHSFYYPNFAPLLGFAFPHPAPPGKGGSAKVSTSGHFFKF
jgi:hypothetical protein